MSDVALETDTVILDGEGEGWSSSLSTLATGDLVVGVNSTRFLGEGVGAGSSDTEGSRDAPRRNLEVKSGAAT